MNTLIRYLISLVILSAPSWASGEEATLFTLDSATEEALRGNPLISASNSDMRAAESRLQVAWGAYVPKLKVRSFLSALPELRGDAVAGYSNTDLDKWGPFFRVQVSSTMPIYAFGQLAALREVARSKRAGAIAQDRLIHQELRYQVHRAIQGWRLARALRAILEEGRGYLNKAKSRLEELEEEDSEEFDQIDLLKIRVYEADIVDREMEIQEGEVTAREGLRVALGYPLHREFSLVNWKLTPVATELLPLEVYLRRARSEQAELMSARANLRKKRAEVEEVRSSMLPSFGVDSFYKYSEAPTAENQLSPFAYDPYNSHEVGVGLTLSWNMSFGEAFAQLEQEKSAEQSLKLRIENQRSQLALDVTETYEKVFRQKKLQKVHKRALKAARSWLMAKSDLYDAGLCELKELNDALLEYYNRKIGNLQAIHDHNVALAHLERLAGQVYVEKSLE